MTKERNIFLINFYDKIYDKTVDGISEKIPYIELYFEDRDREKVFKLKPLDTIEFREKVLPKLSALIGKRVEVLVACQLRGTYLKAGVIDILTYNASESN